MRSIEGIHRRALKGRNLRSNLIKTTLMVLMSGLIALIPLPILSYPAALMLVIFLPGTQIVRWLGLYASWREARTVILSVATGLLVSPIVVYWASLVFGFSRLVSLAALVLFILGMAWLNNLKPVDGPSPSKLFDTRRQRILFGVLLLVLTAGIIVPYIRGYTSAGVYPVEMADWFKHYGVSWAIRHTGVPPVDIFFYGDPSRQRLSYYYFFHLTVATLDVLHGGESSIYLSFVLLTLAGSVSFVLIFYLMARQVLGKTSAAMWSLLFVTIVGGLDVIPMIHRRIEAFKQASPDKPLTASAFRLVDHIDSWAPAPYLRLNSLYVTYLWVPQHVAGLLALFLGLYFFREASHRVRLATVAPLILLAMLGHSTWIALVGFVCLALYALFDIGKQWYGDHRHDAARVLGAYALVALGFLVISAPFLRELISSSAPKSGIVFEIPLTGKWQVLSPFKTYFPGSPWARLLDLPIHYLVELGALLLCGLGGLWLFRAKRRNEPLFPFFILTIIIGFLAISFLASGRAWVSMGFTLNNDLGMRTIMPAQATLALFAGYFLDNLSRIRLSTWPKVLMRAVVGVTIVLGALAFGWELYAMGVVKYLKPPRIDAATYHAFQAMQSITEPLSVVKHHTHDNASSYQLMFGERSPGFFTVEAAVFHPDLREVAYAFGLSRFAYLNRLPAWSYQMFREMHADYVYVGAIDRDEELYPEKFENPTYYHKVYQEEDIAIYEVKDLPLDQMQASFAPAGVEFMGYIIDQAPVFPVGFETKSPQALVTAWRLERPVAQDYTVYIHFVGPAGQVVGQADHQLWAWANQTEGPTSTWEADKIYLDIAPLPQEVLETRVPLQIGVGLWIPETGEYLQADSGSLTLDAEHRLVVGRIAPSVPR